MTRLTRRVMVVCLGLVLAAPMAGFAQQKPAGKGLSGETRKKLLDSLNRGAAFILQQQKPDGSFDPHAGITAVATSALMKQPGLSRAKQLERLNKTLDYLASLAKPDGGIYQQQIPHYMTAVSVSALVAGGRPQDKAIIAKGRQYLVGAMLDEGEGLAGKDKFYGGMSYGGANPDKRADIISLEYGLAALKDAELPADDAAWKKAIAFLQRTQNNTEVNDQKEAINDGGFVYLPGFTYHVDGGNKAYGSATYAGILSYSWANVKKTDARVTAVNKWIRDNYTVDENPGQGNKTLYYYYMVFAKALQVVGEPVITDAAGRPHNWREELARKIMALQLPDGSWVNANKAEMQDNKTLVTAFTLQAMAAILQ